MRQRPRCSASSVPSAPAAPDRRRLVSFTRHRFRHVEILLVARLRRQTAGVWRVGAVMDWRQRTVSGGYAVVELTAFLTHRLDDWWRVQFFAVKGFSDASPGAGLGGVVSYGF